MVNSYPFWYDDQPIDFRLSSGLPKKVDVVIIGAGAAGLTVLSSLLLCNINAIILEEGAVAAKGSGRCFGAVEIKANKSFAAMNEAEAIKNLTAIDCSILNIKTLLNVKREYQNQGGLRLAASENELNALEKEHLALESHRYKNDSCMLDKSDVKALTSSDDFCGGLYIPSEFSVNPYSYCINLLKDLELNKRRVLTGCRVSEVENNGESIRVNVENRGSIHTSSVVYCTNAYSKELLPELNSFIKPYREHFLLTAPLSKKKLLSIPDYILSSEELGIKLRKVGDRVLATGMRHSVKNAQEGIYNDGEISPTVDKSLRQQLFERFPLLKSQCQRHWSNVSCKTEDNLPLIGKRVGKNNEYLCLGFNDNGLIFSVVGGAGILENIIGNDKSTMFCPGRVK